MFVKELIEKLKKMPQDYIVKTVGQWDDWFNIEDVEIYEEIVLID